MFSRRSFSVSSANGPRFCGASPCAMPASCSRRQVARSDEYNPSRRNSTPMPPEPLAWPAWDRIRCLYSPVKRRRLAWATTSELGWGLVPGRLCRWGHGNLMVVHEIRFLPALLCNSGTRNVSAMLARRAATRSNAPTRTEKCAARLLRFGGEAWKVLFLCLRKYAYTVCCAHFSGVIGNREP